MPTTYTHPGVHVQQILGGLRTITGVSTSNTAFIGHFRRGSMNMPVRITNFVDFKRKFGGLDPSCETSYAIKQYFDNGGRVAFVVRSASGAISLAGSSTGKTGIYALDKIKHDIFNIMCIPDAAELTSGYEKLMLKASDYCAEKRAFLIIDIPKKIDTISKMQSWMSSTGDKLRRSNTAVYFPRVNITDPLYHNKTRNITNSGTMAGVYARIDAARGVWKAPAGKEADLQRATVSTMLNDQENSSLNSLGVNVLRSFPVLGNVSWGARTLYGSDQMASEWKYIPVKRTALYIEESLSQGLKWTVFETNEPALWQSIQANVDVFMQALFRQGAFQGATAKQAYFIRCDGQTTTPDDVTAGIINLHVGFAPLKPAEFVVLKLQLTAGQAI